ncbi:hypothetical protein KUTeg_017876 [Tegillarca granosa]|uniref:Peptidylglycine monooxygenase n=1 Tax=Tegillarca granosa TaxID=220873 RepID=A0ABQ9EG80_TEGGR|nr:hypothetical protein KUTeg_017876 [Tegillarca granosa]
MTTTNGKMFCSIKICVVTFTVLLCFLKPTQSQLVRTMELRMKKANVTTNDQYFFSSYEMNSNFDEYIVEYEALANAEIAHHILLYGCDYPGSTQQTWQVGRACHQQEQILFAWAKNAPPLKLPPNVGFHVGKNSKVKYIVVQIHYVKPLPDPRVPDESGIKITLTKQKPIYEAGIFLLAAWGATIPKRTEKYTIDISCRFQGTDSIYAFGYRVHAHSLSTVITGYRMTRNTPPQLIGKGNPQWPQSFYPIDDPKTDVSEVVTINPATDYLIARCTYNSSERDHDTRIGPRAENEMCNFYIMYYTRAETSIPYHTCSGNKYPARVAQLPPDSSIPLPRNPALEEVAHGHHHMGHMGHTDHKPADKTDKTEGTDNTNTGGNVDQTGNTDNTINVPDNSPTVEFKSDFGSQPRLVSDGPSAASMPLGQIGGLATDKAGQVYVFHRGSRIWNGRSFSMNNIFQQQDLAIPEHAILIYDKDGNLIRRFGNDMFYMPHGITVDDSNNIWITDVALHQVMRFPPGEDKPDLILGKRFVPGIAENEFCKPSDVAVMKSGDFFVSDGLSFEFSLIGDGYPPAGALDIPHSLALAEDKQLICVADRENGRIQCFDLDGTFRKQVHHKSKFGTRLFAIDYTPLHGGLLFAVNGPTLPINTVNGLRNPHDVAVDSQNLKVYVGELDPAKIWQFEFKPDTSGTTQAPVPGSSTVTQSTTTDNDISKQEKIVSEADVTIPIIIGCLLVIPIIIIIAIIVGIRIYRRGQYYCCRRYRSQTRKKFNLGEFLSPHHGFDRLSTEESDHEIDPLDDSDQEEYSITRKA